MNFVNKINNKPFLLLQSSEKTKNSLLKLTKEFFELTKKHEPITLGIFNELFVDGFENEQIWSEIELQNKPLNLMIKDKLSSLLNKNPDNFNLRSYQELQKEKKKEREMEEDDDDEEEEEETESSDEEESDDNDSNEEPKKKEDKKPEKKKKQKEKKKKEDLSESSEMEEQDLYDEIDEMHAFVERQEEEQKKLEERNFESDEEEDDDKFEDPNGNKESNPFSFLQKDFGKKESSEDEANDEEDNDFSDQDPLLSNGSKNKAKDIMFNDFFGDEKSSKQPSLKSNHEKRMEKLKDQIEKLEEKALQEKHWSLKGEVVGKNRPSNSLLETHLDFEHRNPKPVITEEHTSKLEELIKQRIQDNAFDDVERKEEIFEETEEKKAELNFEKSKKGLGEEHEEMYLKQVENIDKKKDQLEKTHRQITGLVKRLFYRLDSFSNFTYKQKPVFESEKKPKENVSSVMMEEVIPENVGTASLLAPEEIYQKKKGKLKNMRTESEMTQKDRKRRRREYKRKIRSDRKRKEMEVNKEYHTDVLQMSKKSAQHLLKQKNKTANVKVKIDKDSENNQGFRVSQTFNKLEENKRKSQNQSFNKKKNNSKLFIEDKKASYYKL
ncbi:u3 small nucleolar ribonucleoprotein mpp10 [Anaeramoeba flamelloides]|uniref:U3 small nucleolar ribonucleoprotein protein MPP10 n=1 Tax=Anaeramoeba flamelloides TaxID=1746091 RepID=A0AAV7Y622_9EUKA|nr:u3 small nucleolar ribonucleoprotein mpp10 [Anaeramoeba flamelloides]